MNTELDNALCRDFPLLYADRDNSKTQTSMCWGFEVPDSWEPVIRRLSEKLEPLIAAYIKENPDDNFPPRAVQVKEKYGGLRFYMASETDEMAELIGQAEEEIYNLEAGE